MKKVPLMVDEFFSISIDFGGKFQHLRNMWQFYNFSDVSKLAKYLKFENMLPNKQFMKFLIDFSGNLFCTASGDRITKTYWLLFNPNLSSLYFTGGPILGRFLAE